MAMEQITNVLTPQRGKHTAYPADINMHVYPSLTMHMQGLDKCCTHNCVRKTHAGQHCASLFTACNEPTQLDPV